MKNAKIGLLLFLGLALCAAEELPATYEVTAQRGLNVRTSPLRTAPMHPSGPLGGGAQVEVLEWVADLDPARDDRWARLGDERFVHARYLRPLSAGWSGTYALTGRDSLRGDYTVQLELREADGGLQITRRATYAQGTEGHRGAGRVVDGELRAELMPLPGAAGALEGLEAPGVTISLRRDGSQWVLEERSLRGEGLLRSAAPKPATQPRRDSGVLISIAEDALADKVRSGVRLDQEFSLGRFAHVGVGGGIRAIHDAQLTPAQADQRKQQPNAVWLESTVHGGARVALGTGIPVGQISLGLGFDAGARVDYTVTDLYPIPEGIGDASTVIENLKQVATRSIDLPLSAADARALTPGAKRAMEGRAHVAVAGNLSYGFDSGQGVVAAARVGGFYRLSGRARIEVERLTRDRVRVRLSKAKTHSRGVYADLVLNASLSQARVQQELAPAIDYLEERVVDTSGLSPELTQELLRTGAKAADRLVRKLTRIRIGGQAEWAKEDSFDLAYRFDLTQASARSAYEAAVRGDFTEAARRVAEGGGAVRLDHRMLEFEKRRTISASLKVSVFLSASLRRTIRVRDLHVEDERGTSHYGVWRYDREVSFKIFDSKRERQIFTEVVRRTREDAVQLSLRMRVQILDPTTWKQEAVGFQRLLHAWGMDSSSALPAREDGTASSAYGKTRTQLELEVGDRGLQALLSHAAREAYFQAYVESWRTVHGGMPALWATRSGRQQLKGSTPHAAEEARETFAAAEAFARHMHNLATDPSEGQRERAFTWLGGSVRDDLYALGAVVSLIPRETRTISASMLGKRIQIVDEAVGDRALVVPVAR